MRLHRLVLPGGEQITAGPGEWAIIHTRVRQSVNRGSRLRLGSVCTAEAEIQLFTPRDRGILPGTEVALYQGEEKLGLFTVRTARRTSPTRLFLYLQDRGHRLRKELTDWLAGLTGWPYTLQEFTGLVAAKCGFSGSFGELPNGGLSVESFAQGIVTGEELLSWCAELMGCFVRIDPEGELEIGRYRESSRLISPTGTDFYYQGSLSAGQAPEAEVVGVAIRNPENDHFLPVYGEDANIYTIEGNPLSRDVQWAQLFAIQEGIPRDWTAGTVQLPDTVPVRAGEILRVFDGSRTVRLLVMERLLEDGRQTLSSLGDGQRLSSISSEARRLAQQLSIARGQVDAQTQTDIFNKLTDNGRAQGIFLEDGQLYINASFLSAGILDAAVVQVVNLIAQELCSILGDSSLEINGAELTMRSGEKETVRLSNEAGGLPILYMTDRQKGLAVEELELTPHHLRLGGTDPIGTFRVSVQGGQPTLSLAQDDPKTLSWTYDPSLGKYVLTGV